MTDTWQTIAQRLRTEAPDRGLMLKGAIVIEALAEELAASPASPPAEALPSQTSEVDEAGACCDGYEAQIAVLQQVIKDRDATIAALAKPASEPAGGDVLLELHRLRRLEEARSQQPDWEKLWAEQTEKLETSEEANSSLRDVLARIAIPEGQHFLSQTEAATQGIEQYWAYERGCEHALAMVASRAGAALSPSTSAAEPVAWLTKWQFKAPDYPVKYPGGGSSITRDATEAAQELANKQRWDRVDWVRQTPLYAHPAPAAVESAQVVKEAVEAEREACAVLVDTMARYASNRSLLDDLQKVSDAIRSRASLATEKEG